MSIVQFTSTSRSVYSVSIWYWPWSRRPKTSADQCAVSAPPIFRTTCSGWPRSGWSCAWTHGPTRAPCAGTALEASSMICAPIWWKWSRKSINHQSYCRMCLRKINADVKCLTESSGGGNLVYLSLRDKASRSKWSFSWTALYLYATSELGDRNCIASKRHSDVMTLPSSQ